MQCMAARPRRVKQEKLGRQYKRSAQPYMSQNSAYANTGSDSSEYSSCPDTIHNLSYSYGSRCSSGTRTLDNGPVSSSLRSLQIDYKYTQVEYRICAGASNTSSSDKSTLQPATSVHEQSSSDADSTEVFTPSQQHCETGTLSPSMPETRTSSTKHARLSCLRKSTKSKESRTKNKVSSSDHPTFETCHESEATSRSYTRSSCRSAKQRVQMKDEKPKVFEYAQDNESSDDEVCLASLPNSVMSHTIAYSSVTADLQRPGPSPSYGRDSTSLPRTERWGLPSFSHSESRSNQFFRMQSNSHTGATTPSLCYAQSTSQSTRSEERSLSSSKPTLTLKYVSSVSSMDYEAYGYEEQTPEAQERRNRENLEKFNDVMDLGLAQWRKNNVHSTVVQDETRYYEMKILECTNHIHAEKIKIEIGMKKKAAIETDIKAILNDLAKTRSDTEHLIANMQNLNGSIAALETSLEKHNLQNESSSVAVEKRLSEYYKMRDELKNWQKELQNVNLRTVQATDAQKRALKELADVKAFSDILNKQKAKFMQNLQTVKKSVDYISTRHDEMVGELTTVDIKERFLENLIDNQNESANNKRSRSQASSAQESYEQHVGSTIYTPPEQGPEAADDVTNPLSYITTILRNVLYFLLPSFPAPDAFQ